MIDRLRIRNFRCLVDIDLKCEPLTILVGPNASGKSTILDALTVGLQVAPEDRWRRQQSLPVEIIASLTNGQVWNRSSGQSHPNVFVQALHLDVESLRRANELREEPLLNSNGGNLVNVFATLSRAQQDELAKHFSELVPMYRDVVARPLRAGQHRLLFQDRWKDDLWYEPTQVSDGTLLILAFLVLSYQSYPVSVVTIEEPERGLHPYLVGQLVSILRKLSTGEIGPRSIQAIVATHSSELLEFAEPSEVRFLSRKGEDGSTQIEQAPVDTPDWAEAVREYQGSLGAIWLSGGVGGVPGGE